QSTTGKTCCVIGSAAVETRNERIRAQRPADIGKGPAGGQNLVRRLAVFNPGLDSRQHVELVGGLAAGAVRHAGHEKQACPGLWTTRFARCQLLVPVDQWTG